MLRGNISTAFALAHVDFGGLGFLGNVAHNLLGFRFGGNQGIGIFCTLWRAATSKTFHATFK